MADYKLCCHWLKYLQKDKIYVVLSCAGRKQNGLELNAVFPHIVSAETILF